MAKPPRIPTRKTVALHPPSTQRSDVSELLQRALVLHQKGELQQAGLIYQQILVQKPSDFDALHLYGLLQLQTKEPNQALALIDKAIAINPKVAAAYSSRGNALHELKRLDEAVASYDKAIVIQPDYIIALNNRGNALNELKRFDEAIVSFDKAIAIQPDFADAFYNRGNALHVLKRLGEAIASYNKAIAIKPNYTIALNNRGNALNELKRFDEAIASFDKAIALKPDFAEALYNRGNALLSLRRSDEALASYDKAIASKPDYAEGFNNRGNALKDLRRFDEAIASFNKAIALKSGYAEAFNNKGNVLNEIKRFDEALASYDSAMAIQPDYEFLAGHRLHMQMKLCDWKHLDVHLRNMAQALRAGGKTTHPFPVLGLTDDPHLQLAAAEIYGKAQCPPDALPCVFHSGSRNEKIRIGYYSADFHNHATSILMAELLESHDRSQFELYGFSFGPKVQDEMRQRICATFDHFIDVTNKSDIDIAKLSRELAIDIAVDLKGYTKDSRSGIFFHRCAPVQVNYLGYPGTMGASCIDYIVADKTLIPEIDQQYYSEKIVYLPYSYQVNDATRPIANRVFTREEAGLPDQCFVFCCFNNNYKILPQTFELWMQLLRDTSDSVLWLFEDNPTASRNLRQEAQARGVAPSRLVFAKRMDLADHLARHRLADLFLDTLPCNAHTTASDALWAGLPVLTLQGKSFAARVAASLLNALNMPELIAGTAEQYIFKAKELAKNPDLLRQTKEKLERNRQTSPLFNGKLFAQHLEKAFAAMHQRQIDGHAPDHLNIDP